MANHRDCTACQSGNPSQHVERFQAPSNRNELSGGNKPKRQQYSYHCVAPQRQANS